MDEFDTPKSTDDLLREFRELVFGGLQSGSIRRSHLHDSDIILFTADGRQAVKHSVFVSAWMFRRTRSTWEGPDVHDVFARATADVTRWTALLVRDFRERAREEE